MKLFFLQKDNKCGKVALKRIKRGPASRDPYKKSNSYTVIYAPDDATIDAVRCFGEAVDARSNDLISFSGQNLLNILCKSFGMADSAVLEVRENRPSRKSINPSTGKKRIMASVHGRYYPKKKKIALYAYTATGRGVAFKTLLNTLLHEFCHHLDYYHPDLYLQRSLHTTGFYKRLNSIYTSLKDIG